VGKLQKAQAIAKQRQDALGDTQKLYEDNFRSYLAASRSRQIVHDQLEQLLSQKNDLVSC
jgi:hypothetical protein